MVPKQGIIAGAGKRPFRLGRHSHPASVFDRSGRDYVSRRTQAMAGESNRMAVGVTFFRRPGLFQELIEESMTLLSGSLAHAGLMRTARALSSDNLVLAKPSVCRVVPVADIPGETR